MTKSKEIICQKLTKSKEKRCIHVTLVSQCDRPLVPITGPGPSDRR